MSRKTVDANEKPVNLDKEAFLKLIEVYKVQNPRKYELKKAELEAKLAKLSA